MAYFGNTQQKLKTRINQHLGDVCSLVNQGKTSDSFTKHFAQHHTVARETKLKIGEARKLVEVSIEWQGNPISCNKSFGKLNCTLCMKERLIILEHSRKNPTTIINTSSEFYGACRHKPRFHRYPKKLYNPSTDDERSSEKVQSQIIDNSPEKSVSIPLCIEINPITSRGYSNTEEANLAVRNSTNNMDENNNLCYTQV